MTEDLAPLPRAHAMMLFSLCIGQISCDQLRLVIPGVASHEALLDQIVYPSMCNIITVEFGHQEQAEGFDVRAIRPPSVPEGTARLRVSINAGISEDVIDRFADALVVALREVGACSAGSS